jgi:Holliday junction resolvase RusA-like endonuclease
MSMRELQFMIVGRPQQRGSKIAQPIYGRDRKPVMKNGRVISVVRDDNPKSESWMEQCRSGAFAAMQQAGMALMTGPIELTAQFYFLRPKSHYGTGKNARTIKASAPRIHAQSPDLAKLIRCLEDSLTGVVWHDDKQVFRYGTDTERRWTEDSECVVVKVRELLME